MCHTSLGSVTILVKTVRLRSDDGIAMYNERHNKTNRPHHLNVKNEE